MREGRGGGAVGRRRDVCPRSRAVPLLVRALAGDEHPGGLTARDGATDEVDPAGVDEGGDVGRQRQAPDEHGRVLDVGPGHQDLAHVRVRRPRLDVQVVPVVPPHDEPEVVHGRVGGRPGADDDAHVPAQHLQPRRVPRLGALVGGQPHVPVRSERLGQRLVDADHVALVGDDDDRSPARDQGRAGGVREGHRPVRRRGPGGGGQPRGPG